MHMTNSNPLSLIEATKKAQENNININNLNEKMEEHKLFIDYYMSPNGKNGKIIIKDMDFSHLENAFNYFLKKIEEGKYGDDTLKMSILCASLQKELIKRVKENV